MRQFTDHLTHFVPYDSPRLAHSQTLALCAQLVHESQHSNEPGCTICIRLLAEHDEWLLAEQEEEKVDG